MACRPIIVGGRAVGVACTRGRGTTPKCSEPGCERPGEYLCDWPLGGEKVGKTCDRPVCEGHRTHVAANRDYCGPHGRAVAANKAKEGAMVETPLYYPGLATSGVAHLWRKDQDDPSIFRAYCGLAMVETPGAVTATAPRCKGPYMCTSSPSDRRGKGAPPWSL